MVWKMADIPGRAVLLALEDKGSVVKTAERKRSQNLPQEPQSAKARTTAQTHGGERKSQLHIPREER